MLVIKTTRSTERENKLFLWATSDRNVRLFSEHVRMKVLMIFVRKTFENKSEIAHTWAFFINTKLES